MKKLTMLVVALCVAGVAACERGGEGANEDRPAAAARSQAAGESAEASANLVVVGVGLEERVKVPDRAARASALARVPGGKIVGAELEEEDGTLIYSYDVRVAGQKGVQEVHVDAISGKVKSVEHEEEGESGT